MAFLTLLAAVDVVLECLDVSLVADHAELIVVDAFGVDDMPPVVACIGPVTAATAKEGGLTVDVIADEHTILGLVDALVRWFDQT